MLESDLSCNNISDDSAFRLIQHQHAPNHGSFAAQRPRHAFHSLELFSLRHR